MATGVIVAVVGATGAAGQTTLRILEERKFPVRELRCFASERSVGKTVTFAGEAVPIRRVEARAFAGVDIAICSAGSSQSKEYAPRSPRPAPSSSTIQRLAHAPRRAVGGPGDQPARGAAAPGHHRLPELHDHRHRHAAQASARRWPAEARRRHVLPGRLGRGRQGHRGPARQTLAWARGETLTPKHFAHPIAFNLIPAIDAFSDDGYTGEELKLVNETRKILEQPELLSRRPPSGCRSSRVTRWR